MITPREFDLLSALLIAPRYHKSSCYTWVNDTLESLVAKGFAALESSAGDPLHALFPDIISITDTGRKVLRGEDL